MACPGGLAPLVLILVLALPMDVVPALLGKGSAHLTELTALPWAVGGSCCPHSSASTWHGRRRCSINAHKCGMNREESDSDLVSMVAACAPAAGPWREGGRGHPPGLQRRALSEARRGALTPEGDRGSCLCPGEIVCRDGRPGATGGWEGRVMGSDGRFPAGGDESILEWEMIVTQSCECA